jgi:hypothetical protein
LVVHSYRIQGSRCGSIYLVDLQLSCGLLLLNFSFRGWETGIEMKEQNLDDDIISETESYAVWRTNEDDEGYYYHVVLGGVTLHLDSEEWNELVLLIKGADS